jgi:hypothetical protein
MSYNSIFWLPVAAVLTALGLFLTYRYGRARGNRAMLRGAAWSLLPIAAYLTGSIEMFWKIGTAIGNFASGFAFSPVKWAGIAVTGAAAALFFGTSGRERRKAARLRAAQRAGQKKAAAAAAPAGAVEPGKQPTSALPAISIPAAGTPVPAKAAQAAKTVQTAPAKRSGKHAGAPLDDDMRDVEDILRNRGI